jgi:hypothetical protein
MEHHVSCPCGADVWEQADAGRQVLPRTYWTLCVRVAEAGEFLLHLTARRTDVSCRLPILNWLGSTGLDSQSGSVEELDCVWESMDSSSSSLVSLSLPSAIG